MWVRGQRRNWRVSFWEGSKCEGSGVGSFGNWRDEVVGVGWEKLSACQYKVVDSIDFGKHVVVLTYLPVLNDGVRPGMLPLGYLDIHLTRAWWVKHCNALRN